MKQQVSGARRDDPVAACLEPGDDASMDLEALPEAPVVLITGASGGIGREVALSWARRGSRLVLLARSRGLLETLAAECESEGGTAVVETADVTDEAAVRDVITRAVATHGR